MRLTGISSGDHTDHEGEDDDRGDNGKYDLLSAHPALFVPGWAFLFLGHINLLSAVTSWQQIPGRHIEHSLRRSRRWFR